ncbi:MAG: DUF4394 domain-containing protein [Steroidobacteraceae bacterium]
MIAALAAAPAAQAALPIDLELPLDLNPGLLGPPLRAFGITADNELVRFSTALPRLEQHIGYISGLVHDTNVVGIDFRVQNGLLYGVGNRGGIYTLDTRHAHATLVDRLDIALQGRSFGVDFNPAANALRVVSDTGQNLRHPFAGAAQFVTQNDGFLRYPPAPDAAPVAATGIGAAAYTNNDLDAATATTLFDIDIALDQVVAQSPANSGNLAATGQLGVAADSLSGFDIYSRLKGGVTVENRGFAALRVNDAYRFYQIDLLTGKATFAGSFDVPVFDIAIQLK